MSVAELADLIRRARALPPPTGRERQEQALSFAYGNLALSTNHKPSRKTFVALAISHYGWTIDEAEAWAAKHAWEVE